jgi:hypothetical protein
MPIDERRAPATTIATDRSAYPPDVLLELRVTLAQPGRPRSYDAYLVLERPAAPALIFDGREMSPEAQRPWPAWVKGLPLPARAVGRFVVPLSGLGVGRYRWSVVLTVPGTYRPVVRASTAFSIES